MKLIKPFKGVPAGEIYPVEYEPGDECPPELEAGARELGALDEGPTRVGLNIALAQLPGSNTDPEYVLRAMRHYFGALFTDADEATVRQAVVKKPSDGLKVEEIKAALEAKGVAIPDGVKLRADLAALLDGAA